MRADPGLRWHSDRPAAEAAEEVGPAPATVSEDQLATLLDLGKHGVWEVFGRQLKVANLDKVLFPARSGEDPVTKRDFLRYVAQPAALVSALPEGSGAEPDRYPDGADGKSFWHKEVPGHAPGWLPRWDNPLADPGETQT